MLGIFLTHSFDAGFFLANFSNFVSIANFQINYLYLHLLEPIFC